MIYFAVYIDGEYKQIVTVRADNEKEANQRLIDSGWSDPIRLQEIQFNDENIHVIYNGS